MKKRALIGLVLFGIVVAVIFLVGQKDTTGKFYQGRSLEDWARRVSANDGDALNAIRGMGTNAVPELIRLLQAKDSTLRGQIWRRARTLPPLLRRWLSVARPPDAASVRNGAIRALGILGPDAQTAAPALGEMLRGPNSQERADAAAALSQMGKYGLPVLLGALEDKRPDVRQKAAYALSQLGPDAEGATPALTRLLLDPDQTVRDAAAYALRNIDAPRARLLGLVIDEGDDEARGAAIQELMRSIHSLRQAEPALVRMTVSTNAVSRRQATEALGAIRIPDNATINALTQALSDSVLEVRVAAAEALANVSSRGHLAVPALITCLEDPSPEVRRAAARTLGLIGLPAKPAAPKLTALLEDTEMSVRAAAKEALARIRP